MCDPADREFAANGRGLAGVFADEMALREAGKQAPDQLIAFLQTNYDELPRTALRYAIERFTSTERKRFLSGDFSTV